MKEITFFCHYDTYNKSNEKRNYAVSAKNKIDYIIKCLNKIGYKVNVISASESLAEKGFFKKRTEHLNDNTIILFSSFGTKNKLLKFIRKILINLNLLFFTALNIKQNQKVIVYHSLEYLWLYKFLKKNRKCEFILEVEEIYSDVISTKSYKKEKEIKNIGYADKYIFVTELLQNYINKNNKPYCVSHGSYNVEEKIIEPFTDNKIHVVYSGIIDVNKKGAFMAADCAKYLDENYVIHIIGFGNKKNIDLFKKKLIELNKINKCKIIYDGLKKGSEYVKYLQRCHIGLSTQDPSLKYNDTSFPSKILAYLGNGLRVISIDIPAIRTSNVSSMLYFYKNNDPKEITNLIKNIELSEKYDGRKFVKSLDNKFIKDFGVMINAHSKQN